AARRLPKAISQLPKGVVPQGKAMLTSNNPGGPLLMRAVFREPATPSLPKSAVVQADVPLRFESPSALSSMVAVLQGDRACRSRNRRSPVQAGRSYPSIGRSVRVVYAGGNAGRAKESPCDPSGSALHPRARALP